MIRRFAHVFDDDAFFGFGRVANRLIVGVSLLLRPPATLRASERASVITVPREQALTVAARGALSASVRVALAAAARGAPVLAERRTGAVRAAQRVLLPAVDGRTDTVVPAPGRAILTIAPARQTLIEVPLEYGQIR